MLLAGAVAGVLWANGVLTFDSVLRAFGLEDDVGALVSRLSDYKPPEGDGAPLDGGLPDDPLPDAEALYSFPEQLYPYRALLTGAEQSAYDQAYANAQALNDTFPLHTPLPVDSLERVVTAVLSDHPALFWLDASYGYSYNAGGQVVALTLSYNETASDIEAARAAFDAAVQNVVQQASRLSGVVEQEKFVHDHLLDNVSYVLDAPLNQSAYSALVTGQSVCAGYARAFQHLMQQLGIPCYFCAGYAGEPHAWNLLQLDGEYYNVDVTWDDPLGNESGQRFYDYFNLTDEQIAADHTREGLSVQLPACTGTAYSYANTFGGGEGASAGLRTARQTPEEAGFSRDAALTSLDEYYAHCEEQLVSLGEGTHTFSLLIADESLLQAIFDATENQSAMEHYLPGAATRLGFNGYSAQVSLQGEALADGYWLLTQQTQLTAQQQNTGAALRPQGRQLLPLPLFCESFV